MQSLLCLMVVVMVVSCGGAPDLDDGGYSDDPTSTYKSPPVSTPGGGEPSFNGSGSSPVPIVFAPSYTCNDAECSGPDVPLNFNFDPIWFEDQGDTAVIPARFLKLHEPDFGEPRPAWRPEYIRHDAKIDWEYPTQVLGE